MDSGSGVWWQWGLRLLTRAPVARVSVAAAGADAAQLLGGLIRKEVGVVGHESSLARPFIPWKGLRSKRNRTPCVAFILRVFKDMQVRPSQTYGVRCRRRLER